MVNRGRRIVGGIVGGAIATAVMSAQMVAPPSTDRIGTPPPRRIADLLLPEHSEHDRRIAAVAVHLAIGAASGIVYRATIGKRGGDIVSGTVFGIAVWAIGYQLVIPALGILPPTHRDRPARRAALLEAHLVYGASLGALS